MYPHHNSELDHQSSLPPAAESYDDGACSGFILPAPAQFYAAENFPVLQWDVDAASVHYVDAIFFGNDPADYNAHRRSDVGKVSQPAMMQENLYIPHLAQAGSSIFSDGQSSSRRGSTSEYLLPASYQTSPQRNTRPPSRKRSNETLDDENYLVKEEEDSADSSPLPITNDTHCLPQPPMIVPSQHAPSSFRRIPHLSDLATSIKTESHMREHDLLLRPDERCMIPLPKHSSNKRIHLSSEELVRQEGTVSSTSTTWSIPGDPVTKGAKKAGEQKKQALACLFCRERKIACGRPPAHSPDQTCNQCARRRIKCEYPTESRRGQHKRRRKSLEGEPSSQATSRTNSTSSMAPTTAPLSSSTTAVTSKPKTSP
ncbi:hypothetical protein BU15DRAFT_71078 [Melanogaster broomeanus]|nr:hypothetical protein BU15DRAFT_71078 [Melanogaster broomeanus]